MNYMVAILFLALLTGAIAGSVYYYPHYYKGYTHYHSYPYYYYYGSYWPYYKHAHYHWPYYYGK